jgi:hypothetical protein
MIETLIKYILRKLAAVTPQQWAAALLWVLNTARACKELRELMRPTPWQEGWAYCAAFAEGMVVSALRRLGAQEAQIRRFAKHHTAHVMTNARAFRGLDLLSGVPTPGALWFARHGATDRGHEGICLTGAQNGRMSTVEANTSLDPSSPEKEREGDWITTRVRGVRSNGTLKTQGFLPVSAILALIKA